MNSPGPLNDAKPRRSRLHLVLLASVVSGAVATAVLQRGRAPAFDRALVLEGTARNCIATGIREFSNAGRKLFDTAQQLTETPGAETASAARGAWIELHLVQKKNQMLFEGPVKDRAFWTALFYPQVSPQAIEAALASKKILDTNFIQESGARIKGAYAMEYLLFDSPQGRVIHGSNSSLPRLTAKLLLEGPTAARRRQYVLELARDIFSRLQDAAAEVESTEFPGRFAKGRQDSVDLLAKQIIVDIEAGLVQPLSIYVDWSTMGTLQYDQIEGVPSGTSLSGMRTALDGLRHYYLGGGGVGMEDYVRHVNPVLATRLDQQFKNTAAAIDAIGAPLEKAVVTRRTEVNRAVMESKQLERLCKVDLTSALGITVMFNSNDGD